MICTCRVSDFYVPSAPPKLNENCLAHGAPYIVVTTEIYVPRGEELNALKVIRERLDDVTAALYVPGATGVETKVRLLRGKMLKT